MLHAYDVPPVAVNVTVSFLQNTVRLEVAVIFGSGLTVTTVLAVALQLTPFELEVALAKYTEVTVGFGTKGLPNVPVDHEYVVLPFARRFTG